MLSSFHVFDHVWRHFCSIYPEARELLVDYCEIQESKVVIDAGGMPFFEKTIPFPEQVSWHIWQGKNLPFLFPPKNKELLSETENGQVLINADIIAGAFYFLSGWQEYYSEVRDRFGRFPYAESLQSKHNFVTTPVVNYYFDILKSALEKAYNLELKSQAWGNSGFVTFLSHDIDRLESAWKVEGKKQLLKGNIVSFLNLGFRKLTGHDHWDNVEKVMEAVRRFGAVSTFFWLPQKGKYQQHPNADYDLQASKYSQKLTQLATQGFENGIHGSFGTAENAGQFKAEIARIPGKITGNRFHYLCYDPKKTPGILAEAKIGYDCTLGFAEHFGFRNSYCFPFRPFDFLNLKPYPFSGDSA